MQDPRRKTKDAINLRKKEKMRGHSLSPYRKLKDGVDLMNYLTCKSPMKYTKKSMLQEHKCDKYLCKQQLITEANQIQEKCKHVNYRRYLSPENKHCRIKFVTKCIHKKLHLSTSDSDITYSNRNFETNKSARNVIDKFNRLERISEKSPPKNVEVVEVKPRKRIYSKLRSQNYKYRTNKSDYLFNVDLPLPRSPRNRKNHSVGSEQKRFVSAETQTTPCTSGMNIFINVYNSKSTKNIQEIPYMLKMYPEQKTITDNNTSEPVEEFKITSSQIRACIRKFEEKLKQNGMIETNVYENQTKIFTNIKSNCFLKEKLEIPSLKCKSITF